MCKCIRRNSSEQRISMHCSLWILGFMWNLFKFRRGKIMDFNCDRRNLPPKMHFNLTLCKMLLALFVIAVLNWYETSWIKWLNKHERNAVVCSLECTHMKLMTEWKWCGWFWNWHWWNGVMWRCCYDYIAIFEMAIMCNRKPNENGKRCARCVRAWCISDAVNWTNGNHKSAQLKYEFNRYVCKL